MQWIEIFTNWITYPLIAVHPLLRSLFYANCYQVLVSTGVGQIRYLNRALMRFDSKVGSLANCQPPVSTLSYHSGRDTSTIRAVHFISHHWFRYSVR
jgi:hypothetical protein